jgi:transcriptional regulator with XRE-family HTH domain
MKELEQIIAALPAGRRAKVEARARELIGEEMALRHLRQARRLTQKRLARVLRIGQDSVSRIETRSDMLLSTLRSYVEAMGGSLRLVAEFPDGVAVLSSLGESIDPPRRASPRPTDKRRPRRKPAGARSRAVNQRRRRIS